MYSVFKRLIKNLELENFNKHDIEVDGKTINDLLEDTLFFTIGGKDF